MKAGVDVKLQFAIVGLVAALSVVGSAAFAQAFPDKPVTLIVAFPPGGSTDATMRALADAASKTLGKRVLVENKPGASGTIAAAYLANNVKPDGYTVAQISQPEFRLPHMQKTNFNPLTDFTYIIGITAYTFGVVIRSDSPWKTWQELIAYARANPGKLTYATSGTGSSAHVAMEDITARERIKWLHVPFKGTGESITGLLGGHVDVMASSGGWSELVAAGKLRVLNTWGENRTKRWPNVPTLKDLGYGVTQGAPYGLAGPKGMDPKIVKILHDAFMRALDDPAYVQTLERLEQEKWYRNGEDYARHAREQYEIEKKIVERFGLKQ
jgi:tripartite-type tricarboxylate transporter receptor subunit TctC